MDSAASTRRTLTAGLLLCVVAAAFEALAVPTAMPAIARELGGLDAYGWAFSGFMLATLVGITAAGADADRRGPFAAFAAGLCLFGIGLALAGAAQSHAVLIAGRVVQGLGGGALSAVVYTCVSRVYPAEEQPRMLAMLSSAWVLPALVGPALAGAVTDLFGWRAVFFGLIPLLPVAGALAAPALRRIPRAAATAIAGSRVPAALALASGAGLCLVAFDAGSGALRAGCLFGGAVVATPGVRRLFPNGTLRLHAGLPAAIAAMAAVSAAFFGAEAVLPLLLVELRGQSSTLAGAPLTGASLAWTLGAWVQARYAALRSRRELVALGSALLAGAVFALASLLRESTPLAIAWLAWVLAGLGMGIAHSTISLTVLEEAEAGAEGFASAALQLAHALGVAAGAGLAGAAVAALPREPGFGLAFAATALIALLTLATALRLPGAEALAARAGGHRGTE
jgi:MFS family permease